MSFSVADAFLVSGWDNTDGGIKATPPLLEPSGLKSTVQGGSHGYYEPQSQTPPPSRSDVPVLDLDMSSTESDIQTQNNEAQAISQTHTDTTSQSHSNVTSQSHYDVIAQSDSDTTSKSRSEALQSHTNIPSQSHSNTTSQSHLKILSQTRSDSPQSHSNTSQSHSYNSMSPLPQSSNSPKVPLSLDISMPNPDSHTSIPSNTDTQLLESVSDLPTSPVISQPGSRVGEDRGKIIQESITPKPPLSSDHPSQDTVMNTSSLETENNVLRREIGALSDELAVIRKRMLENQTGMLWKDYTCTCTMYGR